MFLHILHLALLLPKDLTLLHEGHFPSLFAISKPPLRMVKQYEVG